MPETTSAAVKLKVAEALSKDVGRALARMDPEDLQQLKVAVGDLVEVAGKRRTVCKVMPVYRELRGQSKIQLDGLSRENAGAGLDEFVQIRKINCRPAERVVCRSGQHHSVAARSGIHCQPAGRAAGAGGGSHPRYALWQPLGRFSRWRARLQKARC